MSHRVRVKKKKKKTFVHVLTPYSEDRQTHTHTHTPMCNPHLIDTRYGLFYGSRLHHIGCTSFVLNGVLCMYIISVRLCDICMSGFAILAHHGLFELIC
jgi:hypothetical protein